MVVHCCQAFTIMNVHYYERKPGIQKYYISFFVEGSYLLGLEAAVSYFRPVLILGVYVCFFLCFFHYQRKIIITTLWLSQKKNVCCSTLKLVMWNLRNTIKIFFHDLVFYSCVFLFCYWSATVYQQTKRTK